MKKVGIFFLVFFFSIMTIYAELTIEQESDVAFFVENFILEGNKRMSDENFPLLAYMQGQARIDGYHEKLTQIGYDYRGFNLINDYKWTFDDASFVSYVYYKTLGLVLTQNVTLDTDPYSKLQINDYAKEPYNVNDFIVDATDEKHFYYVMKNTDVTKLDYPKLKKGDLILIENSHIMVYIGDFKIAHASAKAIDSLNLGLEVTKLSQRYSDSKMSVIRIKDKVIDPKKEVNMKLNWLDDNIQFDFRNLEILNAIPTIKYTKSEEKWTNSLTLTIEFNAKDGLSSYAFNDNNFIDIIGKNFKLTKIITENGEYVVKVKDKLNNEKTETITISNIDNTPPLITSLDSTIKDNYSILSVAAIDNESGLGDNAYSFDDQKTWTYKSTYEVTAEGEYPVYVKDKAGNVCSLKINVSLKGGTHPAINNIIYGQIANNKRKVSISFLNTTNTQMLITTDDVKPTLNAQWQELNTDKFEMDLEFGTYYVWLKDNYLNIIGPREINVKASNSSSEFSMNVLIYLIPLITIMILAYVFIKKRNNKI